jgi:ligand-binding SRPBCC domain-containing protein
MALFAQKKMTAIYLETIINAPIEKCFDLSRSIDFHIDSASHTQERAVAGKTQGLIEAGETVTWEARHFGIMQRLTVQITAMRSPTYFCDEMLQGSFKSMKHRHFFHSLPTGQTQMIDIFEYETPFSVFGKVFDVLVLKRHMTDFLKHRNALLKQRAENTK